MARIYVDVDDTLAETTEVFLSYLEKEHNIILKEEHLYEYPFSENYLQKKFKKFDYIRDFEKSPYFRKIRPAENSQAAISSLAKNNKLFIVSGRNMGLMKETKKWISKFFPGYFSEIHLVNNNPRKNEVKGIPKHEMFKRLKCSFAVEDDPGPALSISEMGCKVLLFERPWNKSLNLNENLIRVKNWTEVYNLLENGHL